MTPLIMCRMFVLGLPTGGTPLAMYRKLVVMVTTTNMMAIALPDMIVRYFDVLTLLKVHNLREVGVGPDVGGGAE